MNTISQVLIAALTRTCLPPADEQATAASIVSGREMATRQRGSAGERSGSNVDTDVHPSF
jgi:hypothetical protein